MKDSSDGGDDWRQIVLWLSVSVGGVLIVVTFALVGLKLRKMRKLKLAREELIKHFKEQRGTSVCNVCFSREAKVSCTGCKAQLLCLRCSASIHHSSKSKSTNSCFNWCFKEDEHQITALVSTTPPTPIQNQQFVSFPPSKAQQQQKQKQKQTNTFENETSPLLINTTIPISSSYTSFSSLIEHERSSSP